MSLFIGVLLIGFGYSECENKQITQIMKAILKIEGITSRDFIIPSMPELSAEGDERNLVVDIKNNTVSKFEEDELNSGKFKITLEFELPPGAYATIVIKHIFEEN